MKNSTILLDNWVYDCHNLCFCLKQYGITGFIPTIIITVEEIDQPDIDFDRIYFCVADSR